eukprot:scaffold13924_cov117-Amphora_coffeaeformis.AAC.1
MDRAAKDVTGLDNGLEEDPLEYAPQNPPNKATPKDSLELPELEYVAPPSVGRTANVPKGPGPVAGATPAGRIFGLESLDTGDRLVETDMASVQDLRLVGFSVQRTFASYREARKWKSEGVSVEGLRRAPTTLTPVPVSG